MKKSERIEFRVTEEERAAYDRARTTPDGEIPLGAWIRRALNNAAGLKNREGTPQPSRARED